MDFSLWKTKNLNRMTWTTHCLLCENPFSSFQRLMIWLYNQLQILTLPSQYIFSLLIFVVKNKDLFLLNSDIHTINTCNNYNLYMPNTNLTIFQKGVLYSGCKIYNKLPPHIKGLLNDLKRFKSTLKGFLMERTLYSTEKFYQITWNDNDFLPMLWSMYIIYCNLYHIRHSDNLKWLWFLPMLWSMYTIYCNLYYIYSYTLTVSMSAKMYMEGKINYNYNVCTLIKIFFSVYRLVPGWWDFSDVNQSKSTIKSASFLWLQGNLDSGGSNFSSAAALALEK